MFPDLLSISVQSVLTGLLLFFSWLILLLLCSVCTYCDVFLDTDNALTVKKKERTSLIHSLTSRKQIMHESSSSSACSHSSCAAQHCVLTGRKEGEFSLFGLNLSHPVCVRSLLMSGRSWRDVLYPQHVFLSASSWTPEDLPSSPCSTSEVQLNAGILMRAHVCFPRQKARHTQRKYYWARKRVCGKQGCLPLKAQMTFPLLKRLHRAGHELCIISVKNPRLKICDSPQFGDNLYRQKHQG